MNIVLMGAPGAGKGTQAAALVARYDLKSLSTGDLLRAAVDEGTPLGLQIAATLEAGDLVNDDTVIQLIASRVQGGNGNFLFDGFPRTLGQAQALNQLLQEHGLALQAVIFLQVSDSLVVERLLARGRNDDEEEVIRHRLHTYYEKTAPLRDYYEAKNLAVTIDGEGSVEAVGTRLYEFVDGLGD